MPKEFIVAIELGSSKMTGIAGKKNLDGSIQVLAVVKEESSSFIRKGYVYNIDKTAQCLTSIVSKLEKQLRTSITQVYVGVGGQSIRSIRNVITKELPSDTVVTQEQMEEYYHSTPDNFILNTPAVRCIFVQILDTPEDVYNVQRLLNFHSEKDSLALLDFCHEKAAKFETFDNHWTTLAQASNLMPTAVSEKDFALKAHGVIRINEGAYVYL